MQLIQTRLKHFGHGSRKDYKEVLALEMPGLVIRQKTICREWLFSSRLQLALVEMCTPASFRSRPRYADI
jgi:hypothetical protein